MVLQSSVVSITSYLDGLTPQQRWALYESPWTCQAVFRSLPRLAQAYVLHLLLIDAPVQHEVIEAWCADLQQWAPQHRAALNKLFDLGVFLTHKDANQRTMYQLQGTFQSRLRLAIASGGQMLSDVPQDVVDLAPSATELDEWAHNQWEALQMYLLDSGSKGPMLPGHLGLKPLDFHRLLVSIGVLKGTKSQRGITDAGFQFLLSDSHRQLWAFLSFYINDVAKSSTSADLTALMSFLMQLGFMRVGQPYNLEHLKPVEQDIAAHMMQLGLLMPFQVESSVFYCPTRLASSLCAAGGAAESTANADIAGGYIIVEPNFKVNAWTTSRVQRALLALFCRLEAILPNLWVGTLTHDSVTAAFGSGISADEMVAYLEAHAHPKLAGVRLTVVPENVSDQVRLWEAESRRMQSYPAYFYDAWDNLELFEATLSYVRKQGWLLWDNQTTKAFAAEEQRHEQIKAKIKDHKERQARGEVLPRYD